MFYLVCMKQFVQKKGYYIFNFNKILNNKSKNYILKVYI